MPREMIISGPWIKAINSSLPPQFLSDDQLQWTTNVINRGGLTTRPGFRYLPDPTGRDEVEPRGLTIFTPTGRLPQLVKVVGNLIRVTRLVGTIGSWDTLATIDDNPTPVYFANCIKGASNGVKLPTSNPLLVIQTGNAGPWIWDGFNVRQLTNGETPIGTISRWFGSRLWTAQGSKLFASDLLDPISQTESDTLTGGGYLQFNGDITGLAETSDSTYLIVFTAKDTSAIQASILDRSLWGKTVGFQKTILPNIGCIAPKSIVNQYGMLWWMSQNGLVGLDEALRAFRTSRIHYKDGNMSRSRNNLSDDLSGIAMGAHDNFLACSVPSGDSWNSHTWVMDQSPIDDINTESQPIWASVWTGIRPVEWASATVDGNTRTFALSRDYKITGDSADWTSNVWECFTGNKFDIGSDAAGTGLVIKPILCSLETKLLSPKDGGYSTYGFAEALVSGLQGNVHFSGFYSPAHGVYKQVLDKNVVATVDSLKSGTTMPALIPSYLPQVRRIKFAEDDARISDGDIGVEDQYTRNKDRGFSLLLKWQGVGTVWAIILALDIKGDQPTGKVEENETTDRFVSATGESVIEDTLNTIPHTLASGLLSAPVTAFTSRTQEDVYSSMP